MLVVGTEAEIFRAASQLQNAADQRVHIPLGAALAHKNPHADPQPAQKFLRRHALVIVRNAAGGVYVQFLSQPADGVTVDDFAPRECVGDFLQILLPDKENLGGIQLAQTDRFRPVHNLCHLLRPQLRAGCLQSRCGGYAGGDFNQHAVGQAVHAGQHRPQTFLSCHIGNFHQIGAQRGCSLRNNHSGQRLRREHGGLKMHVRVNKARHRVSAAAVHVFLRLERESRFNGHHALVLNVNIRGVYFAGEYIHQLHVGKLQLAGKAAKACLNGTFNFFKRSHIGCSLTFYSKIPRAPLQFPSPSREPGLPAGWPSALRR